MRKLLNHIKPKERVAGVCFYNTGGDSYLIAATILIKDKGKISVDKKFLELSSIEDLIRYVNKSIPLVLNFSGKNTLLRDFIGDYEGDILHEVLPNANTKDLYCYTSEHTLDSQKQTQLSIIRREIIDQVVTGLTEKGYFILDISFGPSEILPLMQLNILREKEVQAFQYKLTYQEKIFSISQQTNQTDTENYWIENEQLNSDHLLSFAIAFNQLVSGSCTGEFTTETPPLNKEDYRFARYIHLLRYPLLAALFLVLIINFMVLNNYRNKSAVLSNQIGMSRVLVNRLDSLEQDLTIKRNLLTEYGYNTIQYSYYCDRIGVSLPKSIVLKGLTINPIRGKIKAGNKLEFEKHILISGITPSSLTLNKWIEQLNQEDWVKDTDILTYLADGINPSADFELIVYYR